MIFHLRQLNSLGGSVTFIVAAVCACAVVAHALPSRAVGADACCAPYYVARQQPALAQASPRSEFSSTARPPSLRRPTRIASAPDRSASPVHIDAPPSGLIVTPPGFAPSTAPFEVDAENFPPSSHLSPLHAAPVAEPMFEEMYEDVDAGHPCDCYGWGRLAHAFHHAHITAADYGFGYERVPHAPFFIETTQPQQMYRFRFDAVYHIDIPDRSEYFWARPDNLQGRGPPAPELHVDYQDIAIAFETGNEFFSTTTNIPIRVLDPVINPNTAGLSDIDLTTKLRLLDGELWQITQFFRTHFNSGAVSKGLGTGHVSLEPGFLFRYKWDEYTYLHSELRYWFATGGHPTHAGQVLRFGLGLSTVLYESDTWAVLPTFEYIHLAFLDGQQTPFFPPIPFDVDGETVDNFHPGLRLSYDTGGDLGIIEFGVASGIAIGQSDWWNRMLRVELRFVY